MSRNVVMVTGKKPPAGMTIGEADLMLRPRAVIPVIDWNHLVFISSARVAAVQVSHFWNQPPPFWHVPGLICTRIRPPGRFHVSDARAQFFHHQIKAG